LVDDPPAEERAQGNNHLKQGDESRLTAFDILGGYDTGAGRGREGAKGEAPERDRHRLAECSVHLQVGEVYGALTNLSSTLGSLDRASVRVRCDFIVNHNDLHRTTIKTRSEILDRLQSEL